MSPLGSEEIAGLGFEQVVRNAPVAISVIDACGGVIYSNRRAHDLTSRQLGSAMPADLDGAIDIFHLDGKRYERHEWPAVRSIRSGEDVIDEEFFYALPEGERLSISCSSSPVRAKDGQIVAAVVAMTDVTERKRAAAQLRYHAGLLDVLEDAVVGTDAEFRLTVWNRGAERLYGYAPEEVLGRDARDVASYEGDASRLELERELLEGDRARRDITAYRKDGTRVEVELIALAVRDEQGEITGYIGTHRDVSERKRLEQRIAEVREAERSRIARDLHDDALQELTEALVRADRGRSAGLGPEAAAQLVSTLQRVSQELRGAIYDLRLNDDVSRPFPETLGALVDVHREMAVEGEILLDVSWEPSAGPVGDRGVEALRIVGEALTNARRHSGARHVRVGARGSDDRACVEVSDDGRGFDPDATSSGADGMGIRGMRERAALLGGDLDIRSAPGAGTTIRFEFGRAQHDESRSS